MPKTQEELRAAGERFVAFVHHDPYAVLGAILEHFEVVEARVAKLEERLTDVMEANGLWSGL